MNNSLKHNTELKDRWSSIPLGDGKIGALVKANTKKHKRSEKIKSIQIKFMKGKEYEKNEENILY